MLRYPANRHCRDRPPGRIVQFENRISQYSAQWKEWSKRTGDDPFRFHSRDNEPTNEDVFTRPHRQTSGDIGNLHFEKRSWHGDGDGLAVGEGLADGDGLGLGVGEGVGVGVGSSFPMILKTSPPRVVM